MMAHETKPKGDAIFRKIFKMQVLAVAMIIIFATCFIKTKSCKEMAVTVLVHGN